MNWVRLDTTLASNHKVLELLDQRDGPKALNLYIFGLGHCGANGTDGFIPRPALGLMHGTVKLANILVAAGLWHAEEGGYTVHDWLEHQPSSEEAGRRSQKARAAAAARWGNAPRNANPDA